VAQTRIFAADLIEARQDGLVREQDLAAAVLERISDFGAAPADVDRIDDRACPEGAQIEFVKSVRVQPEKGDAIALLDPEPLQPAGQPGDAVGQ
jgi:hypothetical protein